MVRRRYGADLPVDRRGHAGSGDARRGGAPIWLVVAVLLLAAPGVPVSAAVHAIDSRYSEAEFSLRVAWVRRLTGVFTRIEGEVALDPDADRFSVDVRISAREVEMGSRSHADWARSEEFFDAERYPWIQFTAADIPLHVLHEGGRLHGELMLRGERRTQRLEVEPAECDNPGLDCPVVATADIRRSDFGMTSRRVVVSDRVRLQLTIQLRK